MAIIRDYKVNVLPAKGEPNSRYYVLDGVTVEEWITDKHGNFRRVGGGAGAGLAIQAGTSSADLNKVTFSNSNGVSFGLSGSVITAAAGFSQSTLYQQTSLMSAYLQTVYTTHTHSQYLTTQTQFVLSNSNGLTFGTNGTRVTASYSVPTDYVSSGETTAFQQTSLMTNYLGTTYTTHTHSQYLNSSQSSLFRHTSQNSQLQFTSQMTDYLGTDYTTHTHAGGGADFVLSNSNGISFGTNASTVTASYTVPTDYISTAQSSIFLQSSDVTDFLDTSYTTHTHTYLGSNYTSHTHSQYLNTSQSSLFRHTSQNSQLQFTSQMSDYLQTDYTSHTHSEYLETDYTSHTHSQYLNTSQSSLFEQSSHTTVFLTSQTVQTQNMVSVQGSTGDIIFSNSNGFTFGFNNSTITASYTVPTVTNSSLTVSDANTSGTLARLAFTQSNGLTLSLSTGTGGRHTVVGSYTVPTDYVSVAQSSLFQHTSATSAITLDALNTSQSSLFQHTSATSAITSNAVHTSAARIQGVAASNTTYTSGSITFRDGNGISWASTTGQQISITHGLQHTSNTSAITANALNTSQSSLFQHTSATSAITSNALNTSQSSLFQHTSATSAITSAAVHTSAARIQGIVASNTTYTSGSVTLRDLNGISWQSTTGQQIQITHALQFTSNTSAITSNALNTSQSSLFQHTSATSAITSNAVHTSAARIQGLVASDATYTSGSVTFRDGNGISWASTTGQQISITHGLQHTSNTSAITSNALNTSASRVINIIAATNSTGGGTASLSSNVSFSNANNMTFYTSVGGAIVGSFSQSVDTGKAGTGFTSAGNNIGLSGTLNTNGLSLSATVAAQTNQTVGIYGSSQTTGSASSGTHDARSLSFIGAGIVSIGNHSTSVGGTTTGIIISATQSADTNKAGTGFTSAGNNIGLSGTLNTNGLSLSATVAAQSNQSIGLYGSSQTAGQSSSSTVDARSLTIRGIGAASVGLSAGEFIISVPVAGGAQTAISGIAASDATFTSGSVTFRDGNGISFASTTGQQISLIHALQYTSNTSAITSNALNTSQSSLFQHTSATSAITSNAVHSTSPRIQGVIGSNTTYITGSVGLRDLNGISWQSTTGQSFQITHDLQYTSNTSAITSNAVHTSAARIQGVIGSNTTYTSGSISLRDLNGISWQSTTGQAYQITHALQYTSATSAITSNAVNTSEARIRGLVASDATYTSGSVTFRDLNGISWQSTTGQQIQITHGLQYTSNTSAITSNALNTSQSSLFQHTSATSAITSAALHTSASRVINIVAATNSTGGGTASLSSNVSFSAANGVTFYTSAGGAVVGSVVTNYRASNDAVGLNTAQSNVTWTVNSSGISLDGRGYAGTGTSATNATITLNSNGLAISVAAPGAAAEANWHHLLGANTAGNTTVSGSTIGMSGVNLTLSGANNSQLVVSAPATSSLSATGAVSISVNGSTISIGAPAASNSSLTIGAGNGSTLSSVSQLIFSNSNSFSFGLSTSNNGSATLTGSFSVTEATRSGYSPYGDIPWVIDVAGQSTVLIDPEVFPNVQFDRVVGLVYNTNATNSSGSHSLSFQVGIYTRNVSTLSLLTSGSQSYAATHSGTQGSYSRLSFLRMYTVPLTATLTDGQYWIAFMSKTASGGANGSYSNGMISNLSSTTNNMYGYFGSAVSASVQRTLGNGFLSVQTANLPNAIAFSDIVGTGTIVNRFPVLMFASSTV